MWTDEQRRKYQKEKTPEQKALYADNLRAKMHAKAIAEGRDPKLIGRPPKLTAEEKKASRIRQNQASSSRTRARIKRKRAEKALAAGRVPGVVGKQSVLSKEQRAENRREITRRSQAKHAEKRKAEGAKRAREKRAAIKAGTWVSKKRLLTPEERRAVNVAMGHARRARIAGAGGKYTPKDLKVLRYRQNGFCPLCNMGLGEHDIHVDHWVPLSKGGHNGVGNLALTHGACNLKKGTRHPHEMGLSTEPLAA